MDIIRAWKDEEYRLSLSEAERALLPESPVGMIELTDEELDGASGGCCTYYCPTGTQQCSQSSCFTCPAIPCTYQAAPCN
jgi:mersacidin/lichenicidin family type 2 lantibiotic